MPVVTGLYTLLLPVVGFAAFGSSRYLVVSADSATAAIFAGGVAGMAPPSSARYVALAGAVALLTAGFLLLARLLKLGFIADFLSQTVLVGFLTGVGFQVGIAVLGEMLGVPVPAHRTVMQLAEVARRLPEAHAADLGRFNRRRCRSFSPSTLCAENSRRAHCGCWSGDRQRDLGFQRTRHRRHRACRRRVSSSWTSSCDLEGPSIAHSIAASCCIMIVTQSAATARIYAARHHQQLDENADLAGLSRQTPWPD